MKQLAKISVVLVIALVLSLSMAKASRAKGVVPNFVAQDFPDRDSMLNYMNTQLGWFARVDSKIVIIPATSDTPMQYELIFPIPSISVK